MAILLRPGCLVQLLVQHCMQQVAACLPLQYCVQWCREQVFIHMASTQILKNTCNKTKTPQLFFCTIVVVHYQ